MLEDIHHSAYTSDAQQNKNDQKTTKIFFKQFVFQLP
jgi:hypothetical protein